MSNLEFYIYDKDTPVAYVKVLDNCKVYHESYSNNPGCNPLIASPRDVDDVIKFLERRCPDRHNDAIDFILNHYGLSVYNPVEIVRKTHGVMIEDFYWIKFIDDPDYTWEDVKHVRG